MALYAAGSLSLSILGNYTLILIRVKHTLYISQRPAFHPSFMMPYPKPTTYPTTPCNCFLRSLCFLTPLSYSHSFYHRLNATKPRVSFESRGLL